MDYWRRYGDEGLAVLGVNITSHGPQSASQVAAWAEEMGITFDLVTDDLDGSVYEACTRGVEGAEGSVTFLALVDGTMTVRYLSWDLEESLQALVEEVLAGG